MNPRIARYLTALYPQTWRQRYQREFVTFLEAHPPSLKSVANVAAWAMYERFLSFGEIPMDARQNSLSLMIVSTVAAFAAGVNFYWTVDDTPLVAAMHNHGVLFASWRLVQLGAVILVAVAILGGRVFFVMAQTAFVNRRQDVISRLAVPFCVTLAILVWLISAALLTHGHWVPTPWDVTGDWAAPVGWPGLATRWVLSSVTFALVIGGFVASAISIPQAISRTQLSMHARSWFATPSLLLTASIVVMGIGVLSWGWFAQRYAPTDFHLHNGGLFSSTNFGSWIVTCAVLLAAAVMAVKSLHSAFSMGMQQPHD